MDTDKEFWEESYKVFLRELADANGKGNQRTKKQEVDDYSEQISPSSLLAGIRQKRPRIMDEKRFSVLQTSVSSFDFTAPVKSTHDLKEEGLCKECLNKTSSSSLKSVFHKKGNAKSGQRTSKTKIFRCNSLDQVNICRFNMRYHCFVTDKSQMNTYLKGTHRYIVNSEGFLYFHEAMQPTYVRKLTIKLYRSLN